MKIGMGSILGKQEPAPELAEARLLRVRLARGRTKWTEIPDPVDRGRWLVDAATDHLYRPFAGATFIGVRLEFASDRTDLAFFVDHRGDVVVLERVQTPATWSEFIRQHPEAVSA